MRSRFRPLAGALLLAVVLPVLGADEKPEVKEKLIPTGKVTAKVARVPGTDKTLGLSIQVGRRWEKQEIPVHDDLKVRVAQLPPAFDDKGKPRKYTSKELEELKGPDRRLPGYAGSLEDLKPGQIVEVHLVRKAGAPKLAKGQELPPEYKPQVGMIVILASPPK